MPPRRHLGPVHRAKEVALVAVACIGALGAPAAAAWGEGDDEAEAAPQLVAVEVEVPLDAARGVLEMLVEVTPGRDPEAVAAEAARQIGARRSTDPSSRPSGATPFPTPERWPQFFDGDPSNDVVLQSYNPAGEPASGGDYQAAVRDAQRAWTGLPDTTFGYRSGGQTTRCPSLFCSASLDGFNDVGWGTPPHGVVAMAFVAFDLVNRGTLEADILLSREQAWFADPSLAREGDLDILNALLRLDGPGGVGRPDDDLDLASIGYAGTPLGTGPRVLSAQNAAALARVYPVLDRAPQGVPGALDPSFDLDGRLMLELAASNEEAYDVALQADGRIVAVGFAYIGPDPDLSSNQIALARYLPDGSLDPSFGDGGRATSPIAGTTHVTGQALAIQTDGSIVVVGKGYLETGERDVAIARFLPDGSLDHGFGADGQLVVDLGGEIDEPSAVAVQPDGAIVVAATTYDGPDIAAAVLRLTPTGALDPAFGAGGVAIPEVEGGQSAAGMALLPDGRIVVAGSAFVDDRGYVGVLRLTTHGALDPTFATNGRALTLPAEVGYGLTTSVAVQGDGRIVVGGLWRPAEPPLPPTPEEPFSPAPPSDFLLVRYLPDGEIDPSFGGTGVVMTDLGFSDMVRDLIVEPDGAIVAVGTQEREDALGSAAAELARYLPDGSLDPSFGRDGMVVDRGTANAVVRQADGALVVTGGSVSPSTRIDFHLARYLPDGTRDPSFGGRGWIRTEFQGVPGEIASAVAVQPDGKIVTVGDVGTPWGTNFGIARHLSDGVIDPLFGAESLANPDLHDTVGTTVTDLGFYDTNDHAAAVAVQPDGMIVVAGSTAGPAGVDMALVRYDARGFPDLAFGDEGKVRTDFAGGVDLASGVVVQPDGKIVVAGRVTTAGNRDVGLARYNPDGSLDATFGLGGKVTTDFAGGPDSATAIALLPDGRVLVAGWASSGPNVDIAAARYRSDGSLDPGFGSGGKVTVDFAGQADRAFAMAQQPDGRVVLTGDTATPMGLDVALVRLQGNGSLDRGFGTGGKVTTDFGGDVDQAFAIGVQANGKIVVAGQTSTGSPFDFAVARYEPNGILDPRFGSRGRMTTDFGGDDGAFGLAVQRDGRILVVGGGQADALNGWDFAVARYAS